jgi:hypothetical protein
MKRAAISAAIFTIFCAGSAFIGWASGYDFDYRSGGVAMWIFCTVMLGIYVSLMPFVWDNP